MSVIQQENTTFGLQEDHPDPAYHCGRLLAVLQQIQDIAADQNVGSYVSQFFSAASSRPAYVLIPIFRRALHRIKQIKSRGLRDDIEALLIRIHGAICSFPTHLNIIEQGNFQLGYFHQLPNIPDMDFRKRLPTKAGYAVKSSGEQFIANLLFDNAITHQYEEPLPIPGRDRSIRPDFTVPLRSGSHTLFIEYTGLGGNEVYDRQWEWKMARYRNELQASTVNDVFINKQISDRVLMEIQPGDLKNRAAAKKQILESIEKLNGLAMGTPFDE